MFLMPPGSLVLNYIDGHELARKPFVVLVKQTNEMNTWYQKHYLPLRDDIKSSGKTDIFN